MGRRGWGAVILAMAVLISVVVPAAGLGRESRGRAVRTPVPPPPVVGDCLLSVVVPDGSALKPFTVSIASARIGPCAADAESGRPGFGEIVSVTADQRAFARGTDGEPIAPEPGACRPAADAYLGWPSTTWAPPATRAVVLVGPDISQYLTGQRWIACAIRPAHSPYPGSIRAAPPGPAADAFGRCERPGPPVVRVPCGEPHTVEVFGIAIGGDRDGDGLLRSCAELAAAVTGMADPTAGGQLRVQVDGHGIGAGGTAPTCGVRVTGNRSLRGSLLSQGPGPLPWS